MNPFRYEDYKNVELEDAALLENALIASEPKTCESNFLNLYVWQNLYETKYQIWNGRPYAYLLKEDELLFPGGTPEPKELAEVSRVVREHGKNGIFYQTPAEYLAARPDYTEYFRIEQINEDFGEYLYRIEDLVELRGQKLHKKKNLISQFERLYPDHRILPFSQTMIPECRALAERWMRQKIEAFPDEREELEEEHDALERAFNAAGAISMTGCCIEVGSSLAAFSICSRISSEMFTVHFEKNDPAFKGSGQMVNRETARMLLKEGTLINREQDLGVEGLRHAKSSYAPIELLRNYSLIPLESRGV